MTEIQTQNLALPDVDLVYDVRGPLPTTDGRESGAPAAVLSTLWAAHDRGDLTPKLVRARREQLLRTILEGAR